MFFIKKEFIVTFLNSYCHIFVICMMNNNNCLDRDWELHAFVYFLGGLENSMTAMNLFQNTKKAKYTIYVAYFEV